MRKRNILKTKNSSYFLDLFPSQFYFLKTEKKTPLIFISSKIKANFYFLKNNSTYFYLFYCSVCDEPARGKKKKRATHDSPQRTK